MKVWLKDDAFPLFKWEMFTVPPVHFPGPMRGIQSQERYTLPYPQNHRLEVESMNHPVGLSHTETRKNYPI